MNIIPGKGTDADLRKAATTWLGMWTALQERFNDNPAYEPDDADCRPANAFMETILTVRATTYEGLCAKAAVLTALDGNSDRLALGLCADIQRLGRG